MLTPTEDYIGKRFEPSVQDNYSVCTFSEDFLQLEFYLWTHWRGKMGKFLKIRGKELTVLIYTLSKTLRSAHLAWMSQKDKYLHEISSDFYFQKSQK